MAMLAAGVLFAALAVIWANPLPNVSPVWKAALAALILAVLVWDTRKLMRKGDDAVRGLYLLDLDPPGQGAQGVQQAPRTGIRLLMGSAGAVQEGIVASGAFVTPFFTAIPYRLEGDPIWRPARILSLWPDSLEREAFRVLRVRLKWR